MPLRKRWSLARVITASDSNGTVVDEAGFTKEKLARLIDIKERSHGRVADYAREFGLTYLEGKQPWGVQADIALPCATQNELDVDAARQLIANGVKAVAESKTCQPPSRQPTCSSKRVSCSRRVKRLTPVAAGHLWPGNGTERRAYGLESGESGRASAPHHAGHPPRLRGIRRRSEADQLRSRREYRRFRESCRCYAGSGCDLIHP